MLQQSPTPQPAPAKPASFALRLFRPIAHAWLWSNGFRVVGAIPDLPKFVIIAAPHTTNWDLPNALATGIILGMRVNWMGKASIFNWPFGGLMRWLGGLSVDRSKSTNAVAGIVDRFTTADRLHLIVAPAGTRSATVPWKSGFYYIAHGAGVPLVLAFIDYKNRKVGIAGVFEPTGDYAADLPRIQAIYTQVMGLPQVRDA